MTDSPDSVLTLASGIPQQWIGGAGLILVSGTIAGATVDLYLSDDGTNWVAIGSQLTDVAAQVFAAPRNAWLKATVAGGSPVLSIKVYREAGLSGWVGTAAGGSSGGGASGSVDIASISYKGQKTSAQSFPVVLASDYSISTSSLDMVAISGTISSAANLSNFPKTDCTGLQGLSIQYTTVTVGNSAVVEESNDGTTWTAVNSILGAASITAVGLHQYNISAKQVRVRCSVYASGSVAATAEFRAQPFVLPLDFGAGAVSTKTQRTTLASDDPAVTSLAAILAKLNSSVAVTGTFWQATQPVSIATAPVLVAGSAIIGKVGIDQTTPGTTDSVSVSTAQGAGATLGTTAGAAVVTDTNGTIQQYLRGLVKTLLAAVGATGVTNPASAFYIGARTLAATPTDTTAQMNSPVLSLNGALSTSPYGLLDNCVSGLTAAMTSTTSTAVTGMGAPGAGLFNYITQITLGNSHATVGTFVEFQDGSGGSTFYTVPAPPAYGGATLTFPKPLKQPTANTGLFVKDTTTGANVIVSVSGFKAP